MGLGDQQLLETRTIAHRVEVRVVAGEDAMALVLFDRALEPALRPAREMPFGHTQADADDEDRKGRLEAWRTWIKDVKAGRTNTNKAGQQGLFGTGGTGSPDG